MRIEGTELQKYAIENGEAEFKQALQDCSSLSTRGVVSVKSSKEQRGKLDDVTIESSKRRRKH